MLVLLLLSAMLLGVRVNGQDCVQVTDDCTAPSPTIYKLGDQGCACDSVLHTGALKYVSNKVYVCTGIEWKTLQSEETHPYGDEFNPGLSCKDILNKAGAQINSGVYWIRLQGSRDSFPVYCDMSSGGWTMVFKAVSGVSAKKVWPTYNSQSASAEFVMEALDVTNNHQDHYKNRIVMNWDNFYPSQAKVVVYKGQTPEKELLFDATGSDKLNWFSFDKLVTSSWTDISTEPRNYFSIQGGCDGPNCRAFFINRNYNGCSIDAGWLVFADAPWCQWENTAARRHHVLYSKRPTYSTWSSTGDEIGIGDTLVVFLQ